VWLQKHDVVVRGGVVSNCLWRLAVSMSNVIGRVGQFITTRFIGVGGAGHGLHQFAIFVLVSPMAGRNWSQNWATRRPVQDGRIVADGIIINWVERGNAGA
jgi:hypothetical protein